MKRFLTIPEVAEILNIKRSSAYEAARQGRLGGVVRIGRQVRIDREQLEAWVGQGGQALPGGWRHE